MTNIASTNIRRLYYTGSIIILIITAVALSIPAYFSIRNELETKVAQLEESIINQKKLYLEAVIIEKTSDIRSLKKRLEKENPGLNPEYFDMMFRNEVRNMIHNTELPDKGYIWINEILNYKGGENYAIRFVHPNLVSTEGSFLSTEMTDINGNKPYLTELEGIKKNGELYFDYYFKKMDSDEISHKLTYAKLYAPYNWVIATGVYLDDVDLLISKEIEKMKKSASRTLLIIIKTIITAITLLVIMVVIFENRINKIITQYIDKLNNSNIQLQNEKNKLKTAYERIENMAYTDFLTGLWNRRAMYDLIKLEISRAKRQNSKFGFIMIDIDHFKKINDSLGHDAGDKILKDLAKILKSCLRMEDSVSRWGGEEFLAMIVNVDREQTKFIAEKLRTSVEQNVFKYKESELLITITLGVSVYNHHEEINNTIKEADLNLFRGKENGRNKVIG